MNKDEKFSFLDYLVILIKWKKFLITLFFALFLVSYSLIYFFVEKKYDASTLILPVEQESTSGLNTLLKSYSMFPSSLTGLRKGNSYAAIFKTLIYSRTSLDSVIQRFNMKAEYKSKKTDETRKALEKNINVVENDDGSCLITCRTIDSVKSAQMANYIVDLLNRTIVEYEVRKTRENRLFLENRYSEVKTNLTESEDSLKFFQSKSGFLAGDEQTKASIETYVKFEADLAVKEIQYSVMQRMYGDKAPQTENAKFALVESRNVLSELKSGKNHTDLLVTLTSLPENAQTYLRLLRNVKIYNSMIEFLIPLYEQARFDEQKKAPVIQIIDKAVPPEERSYPHRVTSALIMTLAIFFAVVLLILFKEVLARSEDEKIKYILNQLRIKKKLPA